MYYTEAKIYLYDAILENRVKEESWSRTGDGYPSRFYIKLDTDSHLNPRLGLHLLRLLACRLRCGRRRIGIGWKFLHLDALTGNYLLLCGLRFQCSLLGLHEAAPAGGALRLLDAVRLRFEGLETSLVHLGAEVRLHGGVIDKVLRTVNAVELGKARLVQVHVLVDQLGALGAHVVVDLVKVAATVAHAPPALQVSVAIVHLLALRNHSHLAAVCV